MDLPSVWTQRHLVLGAIAIFVYVGAEVSIGSFLVNYMSQPYIANIPAANGCSIRFLLLGRRHGRPVSSARACCEK